MSLNLNPRRVKILYLASCEGESLVPLLRRELPALVEVWHPETYLDFEDIVNHCLAYDAIVTGPGPHHRAVGGIIFHLWRVEKPLLGFGKSFHPFVILHGGESELFADPVPRTRTIFKHSATDIFTNIKEFAMTITQTASDAKIRHPMEEPDADTDHPERWEPSSQCPNLVPLAWCPLPESNSSKLMAARHKSKPLWAVQLCIETSKSWKIVDSILKNWWEAVKPHISLCPTGMFVDTRKNKVARGLRKWCAPFNKVLYRVMKLENLESESICEVMGVPNSQNFLIKTPRYSIIPVVSDGSWTLEYSVMGGVALVRKAAQPKSGPVQEDAWDAIGVEIFDALRFVIDRSKATGGHPEIPFWGGFLGFFSYEMCIDKWEINVKPTHDEEYDAVFLWTERSIVINNETGEIFIQSIRRSDDEWLDSTARRLVEFSKHPGLNNILFKLTGTSQTPAERANNILRMKYSQDELTNMVVEHSEIVTPNKARYTQKISRCKQYLEASNPGELHLADQTVIKLPACKDDGWLKLRAWILYKQLAKLAPGPYSAYVGLEKVRVISSSLERHIQWDRAHKVEVKPAESSGAKADDPHLKALSDSFERLTTAVASDHENINQQRGNGARKGGSGRSNDNTGSHVYSREIGSKDGKD
ncbi:predicted protein [Uncinocarpus reesii 1704]|uniref:Anthranilate synthase component I N-terminal domain-containing protein n=1 Tax=Uncinocarpus reesii (strain UAMH 1704) TaxID=336963 RepID=C4JNZ5_UNCRE|nr:uncharacterized protein UREG_03054 [Uncinocarpus reesii 1704]EEP78209.1 predicted protein [Uncinocarpus reesii 1704]